MSIPPSDNEFKSQFMRLGKNLEELIQSAWDSPERKKIQDELENGFSEVFQSLSKATADFRASGTGQQLEHDLEDLRQQIASGEMTEKVRGEILHALQLINDQIEHVAGQKKEEQPFTQTPPTSDDQAHNSNQA